MGNAQNAVDSDYSGRPVRGTTAEELAAADPRATPREPVLVTPPDGQHAIPADGAYYLKGVDCWPDYDRPVDPETGDPRSAIT